MGNNGSRSHGKGGDYNRSSGHGGFTPFTPQKRPGSISATVANQPLSNGQTFEASLSPTIEDSPAHTREDVHISSSVRCGEGGGFERLDSSTHMSPTKQPPEISPVAEASPAAVSPAAVVSPSRGAVYGAAYPPHMAAVMMQREMEKQGKRKDGGESPSAQRASGEKSNSDEEAGATPNAQLSSHSNGDAAAQQQPAEREGQRMRQPSPDMSAEDLSEFYSAVQQEAFKKSKDDRNNARFASILEQPIVNLTELQTMCWSGCPMKYRPNTWRLLLRYMPANADRRAAMMTRLRSEYKDAVDKYFTSYNESTASLYDKTMYRQIAVDLPRTNPSLALFQNERVQQSLHRILYVWGIRHPGTGYVQGINDLVTPFFFVFLKEATGASEAEVSSGTMMDSLTQELLDDVEADSYHCLTNMLDNAQDNYVMDSKGIQEKVFVLKRIIARLDDKLFHHLEKEEVEFLQFSFRWFNCLLMREFSLQCTLRLWDTYVAEKSFAGFHVYVCAAVLLSFSKQLQTMEFPEMIVFLQKLPTEAWDESKIDMLVAQAYSWNQQWSAGHI